VSEIQHFILGIEGRRAKLREAEKDGERSVEIEGKKVYVRRHGHRIIWWTLPGRTLPGRRHELIDLLGNIGAEEAA
jgi:hypothetical protein